jgi:hypothetical protein
VIFLSCKANAGVQFYAKTGHGPHSPAGTAASPKCLYTVALLEAVTLPLWVQIPESLPTKVCPSTFVCLIKRKTPCIPVRSPKLRHNPVSVMHNSSLSIVSLLLSPEMRSHAGMAKQTRGRRLRFTQESAPS